MTEQTEQPETEIITRDESEHEPLIISSDEPQALVSHKMLELAFRFGKIMATADVVVGEVCRNNVGNATGVALQAIRWGLDPYAMSHECYVVNKKLSYSGKLLKAVVDRSQKTTSRLNYEYSGEGQERKIRVYATFKGEDEPKEYVSPMLKDIRIKNSPLWKDDPDQQLAYYGATRWAKRHASDVLMGVMSIEDAQSIEPRDVTPKKLKPLKVKLEDLTEGEPEKTPEDVDETIEEAVVVEEDTAPVQEQEPEVDASSEETADASPEPSETPNSGLWDTMDLFIKVPNKKSMVEVWRSYLKEETSAPDCVENWTKLQQHEAFKAVADDAQAFMRQLTNKTVDHLEASTP